MYNIYIILISYYDILSRIIFESVPLARAIAISNIHSLYSEIYIQRFVLLQWNSFVLMYVNNSTHFILGKDISSK